MKNREGAGRPAATLCLRRRDSGEVKKFQAQAACSDNIERCRCVAMRLGDFLFLGNIFYFLFAFFEVKRFEWVDVHRV